MAKTSREKPKKADQGGNLAVMEPPEPVPAADEPVFLEEEAEFTKITETAGKDELDKQDQKHGRGATRPAIVGFFQRLQNYTPEDWENKLLLYIYRIAPITDRLATGNQYKFIGKFTEPIDEDSILKNQLWGGSGVYRLTLNLKDPTNGKSKITDQVQVELENPQYPPRVPPGEWVDDPRNKRFAWAKEKEAPAPAAAAPAMDPTAMLTQTVTLAKDLAKTMAPPVPPSVFSGDNIVELITKNQEANDPGKVIAAAKELVSIAKPAETKPDTTALDLVKDELKAMREANAKLMDRFLDAISKPPPTPPAPPKLADQVTEIATMATALKTAFGGDEEGGGHSHRSNMSGWQEFFKEPLTEFMSGLKPILGGLGTIMVLNAQQKTQQAQQQQGVQRPAQPTRAPAPFMSPAAEAAMGYTQPQPAQTSAPQPAPFMSPAAEQQQPQAQPAAPPTPQPTQIHQEQPMPSPEEIERDYQSRILSICLNRYLDRIRADLPDEEAEGSDLAAFMCDDTIPLGMLPPFRLKGIDAFIQAQEAGRDMILAQFQSAPELWAELAGTPEKQERFLKYVDEFLSYDPDKG